MNFDALIHRKQVMTDEIRYVRWLQKQNRTTRRELAQARQDILAYQIRVSALEAKLKRDAVR